jgi:hypothetical protein
METNGYRSIHKTTNLGQVHRGETSPTSVIDYPRSRLYQYCTKQVPARLQGHYSYLRKADRRQAPMAVFRIRVHLTRNPDPAF